MQVLHTTTLHGNEKFVNRVNGKMAMLNVSKRNSLMPFTVFSKGREARCFSHRKAAIRLIESRLK